MDIKNKYFITRLLMFLFVITSCQNNESNNQVNEKVVATSTNNAGSAINMLKEFYTSYITAQKNDFRGKSVDAILSKYLTSELIEELNNKELDCDPIVNAQDISIEWLKTLEITKNTKKKNVYDISYNGKQVMVQVSVIENNKNFRINEFITGSEVKDDYSSVINTLKGNWRMDCESSNASIKINDNDIFIALNSNQIYIKTTFKVKHKYSLDLYLSEPKDLGRGGINLNWNYFSKDSIIGRININPHNKITFNWLGFYDEQENKRVWIGDTDFQFDYDHINKNNPDFEESDNYFILQKCK